MPKLNDFMLATALALEASGTTEGAEKGWETRVRLAGPKDAAKVHSALRKNGFSAVTPATDTGMGQNARTIMTYTHPNGARAEVSRSEGLRQYNYVKVHSDDAKLHEVVSRVFKTR